MNDYFYFILKNLFVFMIFKLCPDFFSYIEKRFDGKAQVIFKIYDIINWETNNCNTHIGQYLKKYNKSGDEIWSVNRL